MYESLKKWLKVPVKRIPFIEQNSAGDKTYDTAIDLKCFPEAKTVKVINKEGTEVLANWVIYFDGTVEMTEDDLLEVDGKAYTIQALGGYYEGNTGEKSVLVVYL